MSLPLRPTSPKEIEAAIKKLPLKKGFDLLPYNLRSFKTTPEEMHNLSYITIQRDYSYLMLPKYLENIPDYNDT